MARQPPPDPITEQDLRMPEFRGVNIADLERREDGTIARKDRWEQGIRTIAGIVGLSARSGFEVADVVAAVREHDSKRRIVNYIKAAEAAARARGESARGRAQHDLASMSALAITLIEGIERGDHNAHSKDA